MRTTSTRTLIPGLRTRQPRVVARAISLIESRPATTSTLLRALPPIGLAHRIGITGPPGAGKSTLIAQLAQHAKRPGRPLAIIAVDPTSPISGGAFLGDRVRMQALATDPRVFIRSMATRGSLTGLAPSTARVADLFDAARFDPILIETVGAGQADTRVARLAHTLMLVLTPGLGDMMQWLKAGVLELAHILVVNKADHPGASRLVTELRRVYRQPDPRRWAVPVIATVAERGEGVPALADAVRRHRAWIAARRR